MANEYAVNQSDLVLVADAIRNKNETLEALEFPDGFVEAIEGIKGGGAITVKAYESEDALPSSADDGEIALISTSVVANVYVQSAEPNGPQEGDVWIVFDKSGNAPVVSGNITFFPTGAYQYVNGWAKKTMLVWHSGKWNNMHIYLFDNGDTFEDKTGGWSASGYSAAGLKNTQISIGDRIVCKSVSGTSENTSGVVGTKKPIEISNKSILKVAGSISNYKNSSYYYVGILITKGDITQNNVKRITLTGEGEFEKSIDISNVNGNYYVYVGTYVTYSSDTYTSTLSVKKIVIE